MKRESLYSRLLSGAVLPVYYAIQHRPYRTLQSLLRESQWWSPEKLRDFQWRELQPLLDAAFGAPYYREKYQAIGINRSDIKSWEDFERLPVLTRSEVNGQRDRLVPASYQGKLLPKATGGSSGTPTRFYITLPSYDWRIAATERAYGWAGCHPGTKTLYLWGAPIGTPSRKDRFKGSLLRSMRRETLVSTFSQSRDTWFAAYRKLRAARPKVVVGYVSSLEQFSRFAKQENLRIDSVESVIAAAEPVRQSFRKLCEDVFGCPVYNTYGSREFMSIGAECEVHNGLHINSENLIVETKTGPDSESSEILITDLHNLGMPFVRYSIGDMGVLGRGQCPCGRGNPLLRSIDGRVLDVLRSADGRVVPGEFIPHLMKEIPEVVEFQAEQRCLETIELRVVLCKPLSEASSLIIQQESRKLFGPTTSIEITPVESIPRLPSGKRRVTVGLSSGESQ